jgi:hypothetical protein
MSQFANIPTETLQQWLAAAMQSRQQQMVGPTSASSSDGRRIAFERSPTDLNAYILQLSDEISRRNGCPREPIVIGF